MPPSDTLYRRDAPATDGPDWNAYRAAFPALQDTIYLNAAGGGPMCRAASEAGQHYYRQTLESGDRHWPDWLAAVEDCRTRLARMLNVAADDIAFLQNASLGLNHAATILTQPGMRAVLPRAEFPSVSLAFINAGCEVEEWTDGALAGRTAATGAKPLTGGDLLVASHVQYSTGFRHDFQRLAALFDDPAEARLVIDATQSMGVIPVDASMPCVQALTFSVYKWLGAGYGVGVLYLRPGLLDQAGYPAVGWRSAADPYAMVHDRLTVTGHARDLELGHPPIPQILALNEALKLIETVGISHIEQRVAGLSAMLVDRLSALGYTDAGPSDAMARAGIVTLPVADPKAVVEALKRHGIVVSGRGGRLRISVHAYTTAEEIDRFCKLLPSVCPPCPAP